ncbi:iron chelate uptake ABC transporter family permease subunit [Microlunatus sp. Gsoil 973]|uniref:FecCD family ABC transporter permease n=1 Tax=Microlunatus sp. Gsoil 973 TaxID=2672569 RepID=UPI001E504532|nr:iron chelate uptake ABC transporter family permease subunit [Microlunatus sp. Gsoil 973]
MTALSRDAVIVRSVRHRSRRRTMIVTAALSIALLAVFVLGMTIGDFPLSLSDLFRTLTARGTAANNFVVYDLRLPRVITGILVGLCFGISGAIFQSMIRNPLATPDIIGVSAGASAAAVFAILILGLSGVAVSAFAFTGALVIACAIYLLAYRNGLSGYRFVLIGIGLAAVMIAVINYLMTRAQIQEAQSVLVWLTGSLNDASTPGMLTLAALSLVIIPLSVIAGRWLGGLQLSDDTAAAIGVSVQRSRLLLILLAVALAAIATAAAGPVGFVAFVSGPISRRLTGGTGTALIPAGLVGAVVVSAADLAAQHLLPIPLPVGILTAVIGAPYLIVLLIRTNQHGTGG